MFNTHISKKNILSKTRSYSKGFTIIELLVVIAIIGLISSVVLVSMRGSTGKAKIAKSLEFSQTILNTIGVDAVGVWSFDEGSGDYAYDKSGYGNRGTFQGGMGDANFVDDTPHALVNEGAGRTALSFNGTTNYINCGSGSSLNITDAITIEAWVKPNTGYGEYSPRIVTKADRYPYGFLISATTGKVSWTIRTGGSGKYVTSDFVVPENKWTHIVVIYDRITLRQYFNGVKDTQETSETGAIDVTNKNLFIGDYGATTRCFNGLIDEVRIYASALSSAEIQQHYADSAPRHNLAMK